VCVVVGGVLLISCLTFAPAPAGLSGLFLIEAGATAQLVILVTEFRATLGALSRVASRTLLAVSCVVVVVAAVSLLPVLHRGLALAGLIFTGIAYQTFRAISQQPMSTSGQNEK
ncbi:MAG: hypothetical protein WCB04_00235, partial [Mycobacteriales bacterium]